MRPPRASPGFSPAVRSDGSRVKRYACTTFTPTTVRVKARLDDRASDPDVKV